jgi:SSS family solute:Na+ symporter
MSSVDSYLNSAATIVSHDFYKRFINPAATQKRLLGVGRVTTLALVVWAIGFASLLASMSQESGLYAIFQTLMAFFQGPALAVLLAMRSISRPYMNRWGLHLCFRLSSRIYISRSGLSWSR